MSQASARGRRIGLASFAMLAMTMLAITGSAARAATPVAPAVAAPTDAATVDPVIQWNRILLGILSTPGAQPATIHPTRSLAILHAAIYDAVDSIQRTSRPYLVSIKSPRRADPDAAAAAAGYTVLSSLYPSQQETIAAQFASSLAQVPNGYHKFEGVRVGQPSRRTARASRRRRLERRTAGVHAGHAARGLPADPAGVRAAGPHPLAVRPPVRAPDARASSDPPRRRP